MHSTYLPLVCWRAKLAAAPPGVWQATYGAAYTLAGGSLDIQGSADRPVAMGGQDDVCRTVKEQVQTLSERSAHNKAYEHA